MGSTGGWGCNSGKTAKNCMKMTKSAFLGQNSWEGGDMGGGGQANFLSSGGNPPSPPTGGNPVRCPQIDAFVYYGEVRGQNFRYCFCAD